MPHVAREPVDVGPAHPVGVARDIGQMAGPPLVAPLLEIAVPTAEPEELAFNGRGFAFAAGPLAPEHDITVGRPSHDSAHTRPSG